MKTTTRLWTTLDAFTAPAAVLTEWRLALGPEFDATRVYFRPTQQQARTFPCTHRPQCDCRHEVVETGDSGALRAVCHCDIGNCPSLTLQPRDILIHALDSRKFCRAIRAAFGFDAPPDERAILPGAPHAWPVGTYGATHSPVYLIIRPTEPEFLKEVEGLITGQADPFILLAPTECHLTPTVQTVLQRQKAIFIPLSLTLALAGPGRFQTTNPIQPILDRFAQGLAEGKGLVKTVEKFGRDMDAVAKGNYELRKENEELRRLASDGYFNFVLKVEPLDFRYFAMIFALGDRAKAAEHFSREVKWRTFYERVESWKSRGSEYQLMYRIMKARKKSVRHIHVRLNESIQSASTQIKPENPKTLAEILEKLQEKDLDRHTYPKLLQDILNALLDMNEKNWRLIRDELVTSIREEIPQ